MNNHIRYLARFKVESTTPIGIGSGFEGLVNDRLIVKDANGVPYIPGTSLAGIVRHELMDGGVSSDQIDKLFGYQKGDEGQGSRIIFSPGLLVAANNNEVLEGLQKIDFSNEYYAGFKRLPERDHVRINDKGTAIKYGKFEEELVFKGTRFVFELELEGTMADESVWFTVLNILNHPSFRVGAGTRKGFGQLQVLSCKYTILDLEKGEDIEKYLNRSSSLNEGTTGWEEYTFNDNQSTKWLQYHLELKPENFFLFGAGTGDQEVDMRPKTEKCFIWEKDGARFSEEQILIPATSIKGAISHRVAFHFNTLTGTTIESSNVDLSDLGVDFSIEKALDEFEFALDLDDMEFNSDSDEWDKLMNIINQMEVENSKEWHDYEEKLVEALSTEDSLLSVGENNKAVRTLFGYAKTDQTGGGNGGARGKVIFSDVYLKKDVKKEKIFNHVALDRFTGGSIDGALFQERVVTSDTFTLDVFVEEDAFGDQLIQKAFEKTLDDLTCGLLQLGGASTKGHGVFTGDWKIKNKEGNE